MRKIVILLLLSQSYMVSAQSLSGNLKSEASDRSLSYGNVDIYQEDVLVASVLTDELGNFNVPLDTGVYKCVINYAGHLPVTKEVHVTRDEKADFAMEEDPTKPKPVLIRGARAYDKTVDIDEMRMEAIEVRSVEMEPMYSTSAHTTRGKAKRKIDGYFSSGRAESGEMERSGGELGLSSDSESLTYGWSDPGGGKGGFSHGEARSGALTAGEINDFSKWKMWQDLTDAELKSFKTAWKIAPVGRYTVQLTNLTGLPLSDAKVNLMSSNTILFTAHTDNTGKAELWLSTTDEVITRSNLKMKIEYKGQIKTLSNVTPFDEAINHCTMDVVCNEMNDVDIAFVVDATGSMGDELSYLQAEMNDVIFKSKQISEKLNFHFANVFYRDLGSGEEYATRTMDFSRVLSESVQFINEQSANGGGDYEEAVELALDEAIHKLTWSEEARARVLFLILDAPPHNTPETRKKMNQLLRDAAAKGIRIVPVGASGINKSTEYLMRTLAVGTNGTYTFLTNHSGIGNSHIEPSTDAYKVETFNDLMVRVLKSFTYMPDCSQNVPDLQLDYPDSLVTMDNPADTLADSDSTDVRDHHHTNPFPKITWSYFPNPTDGILNIKASDDIEEIYLTDLSGKLMTSIKALKKDRVYQMDLTAYTTGIYLLRYLHEDRWISGKVVLHR